MVFGVLESGSGQPSLLDPSQINGDVVTQDSELTLHHNVSGDFLQSAQQPCSLIMFFFFSGHSRKLVKKQWSRRLIVS